MTTNTPQDLSVFVLRPGEAAPWDQENAEVYRKMRGAITEWYPLLAQLLTHWMNLKNVMMRNLPNQSKNNLPLLPFRLMADQEDPGMIKKQDKQTGAYVEREIKYDGEGLQCLKTMMEMGLRVREC